MRLQNPEQLLKHTQPLAPMYLVSGDEQLLQQESCDLIRQQCRQQGFNDRQVFHIQSNADWQDAQAASNSLSLFAERQLIEIRLPAGKVNEVGKKALLALVEHLNPDNVILISCPKLEASSTKSNWLKAIEQNGIFLPVWPLNNQQLPQWLKQRLSKQGLSAEPEALQLIAERVEGNLLAAQQEIDKLALIINDSHISANQVLAAVADSSRYNVFSLMDHCLNGNAQTAIKTLHGLRAEGTDALPILALMTRDVRRLYHIKKATQNGQNISNALQKNGVFRQQQGAFQQALNRLGTTQLTQLLSQCQIIDQSCKGLHKSSPWILIEQLIISLSSQHKASK